MSTNWQIGDKIENRWEIHKILKGGMGIVYVVYDHATEEALAAKTFQDEVFAQNDAIADLFKREASTWIELENHENITQARFVENIGGKPFLFLEYVSGGDLSSWIGTPRLKNDLSQILRFSIQFCDGIIHALSRGIKAHRDIKPANCLVTKENVLKVTDFGLAKVFDEIGLEPPAQPSPQMETLNVLVSRTGAAAGTPPYMAPEQFDDAKRVGVRSDIYSFGVMLFEMLEGRLPFLARTWPEIERLHKRETPPRLTLTHSSLASLVERCLAKEESKRFDSFETVRRHLGEIYKTVTGQDPPRPATGNALDAVDLFNKGRSLGELDRHMEAIVSFDRAIALTPDYAYAHLMKGVSLLSLDRSEEAIACYDRAITLKPDCPEAHYNKGYILAKLGRREEAIGCFDGAIALSPDDAQAHLNKGISLRLLGRYEEAIDCFNRAIALKPDDVSAYSQKGLTLAALDRLEEALECYDRAITLKPQDVDAYVNKGYVLAKLGRREEAIGCYDRAIALKPDHGVAYSNKGFSLEALDRFEEAIACYDRAIALEPDSSEPHFGKGISLVALGRHDEAIDSFDRAIALKPADASAHYNKGVALELLGRFGQAVSVYQNARDLGHIRAAGRIEACLQEAASRSQ
jgi:tetratricopeptide (TPR) repeat protein